MAKTNIGWADKSLNFYNWYCTKVSEGCKNCYMFAMRKQFGRCDTELMWRSNAMKEYDKLQPGEVVFVNSMSDTYHEDAPDEWVRRIHNLVANRGDVTFLLLTKRPGRVLRIPGLLWPDNLWLGTSVENRRTLNRITQLADSDAKHKFISAEPLLEDLLANDWYDRLPNYYHEFRSIQWMIVGGESGSKRRPFHKEWARELQEFCHSTGTHFTFKQGAAHKPGRDYELDGATYLETPFVL